MHGVQPSPSPAPAALPSNYQVVGTGDLNGDHKTDILLQTDTGQLGVWTVNADGSINFGNFLRLARETRG